MLTTFGLTADAITIIWTGNAGDKAWSNPLNWSPNVVPGAADRARFTGSGGSCQLVSTVSVGEIYQEGGRIVLNGNNLLVSTKFYASGGEITGAGLLSINTVNQSTYIDNYTVKCNINGIADYHRISNSVFHELVDLTMIGNNTSTSSILFGNEFYQLITATNANGSNSQFIFGQHSKSNRIRNGLTIIQNSDYQFNIIGHSLSDTINGTVSLSSTGGNIRFSNGDQPLLFGSNAVLKSEEADFQNGKVQIVNCMIYGKVDLNVSSFEIQGSELFNSVRLVERGFANGNTFSSSYSLDNVFHDTLSISSTNEDYAPRLSLDTFYGIVDLSYHASSGFFRVGNNGSTHFYNDVFLSSTSDDGFMFGQVADSVHFGDNSHIRVGDQGFTNGSLLLYNSILHAPQHIISSHPSFRDNIFHEYVTVEVNTKNSVGYTPFIDRTQFLKGVHLIAKDSKPLTVNASSSVIGDLKMTAIDSGSVTMRYGHVDNAIDSVIFSASNGSRVSFINSITNPPAFPNSMTFSNNHFVNSSLTISNSIISSPTNLQFNGNNKFTIGSKFLNGLITNVELLYLARSDTSYGMVTFNGTTDQLIDGPHPFNLYMRRVKIDKPNGLLISDGSLHVLDSIIFKKGYFNTNSPSRGLLFDYDGIAVIGASDESHCLAKIDKKGAESFAFPLGDGTKLRLLTIDAGNVNDRYIAHYESQPHNEDINAKDDPNIQVANCEFWTLSGYSGSTERRLYMHFKQNHCLPGPGPIGLRWSGSQWQSVNSSYSFINDTHVVGQKMIGTSFKTYTYGSSSLSDPTKGSFFMTF